MTEHRNKLLAIIAAAAAGLLIFDKLIYSNLSQSWHEQSARITELRDQLARGNSLLERKEILQEKWAGIQENVLPDDSSKAEDSSLLAVSRWVRDSGVTVTSLTPRWRGHDEGFSTLDCRATLSGNLDQLSRFLNELETDPLAVRLESAVLASRNESGSVLTLDILFSVLRLSEIEDSEKRRG
ncbi:hypothetical protein P0Y35_14810 [Kiritimatiellaeota bacterium B1221]|nr:hypothetical protein [Kiritimatiellaeota bacterium B1221]